MKNLLSKTTTGLQVAVLSLGLLTACTNEPKEGPACGDGEAGGEVGDLAEDFGLQDQDDKTVLLSDYCGDVVLLDMGAMWCTACQSHAEQIPALVDKFGDEDLVVLNVIAENPQFDRPTIEELERWAVTFDLQTPVLGDIDWKIWNRYFDKIQTPGVVLIGRDGRILSKGFGVSEQEIQDAL